MSVKKMLIVGGVFLLCSIFVQSQSLVELAKKEKERREKYKDKNVPVITNADLKNLKKKPAVEIPHKIQPEPSAPIKTPGTRIRVTQAEPSSSQSKSPRENLDIRSKSLEEEWKKAQEMVGLLTLKMNALWQEFYSLDDMTSRDKIQQEISTTYLQLQKAQQEEERLRKELEKQGRSPLKLSKINKGDLNP